MEPLEGRVYTKELMAALRPREFVIIALCVLADQPLRVAAARLDVGVERVRQMRAKAFRKMADKIAKDYIPD